MLTILKLAALLLLSLASEADSGLIARVERTELLVSGKPYQRIEKEIAECATPAAVTHGEPRRQRG